MNQLSDDRRYCAQILIDSGSTFFASFALLPKPRREALMALYAFCRQVDDIADQGGDPDVATAKLMWWQQEILRVFELDPSGAISQHPIGRCLREDVARFGLDKQYFFGILEGVQSDLHWGICADREQLMRYCYKVSCCVGLLSIAVFGYEREQIQQYAIQLGYAMQLTNIIRDVRQDAEQKRVYLPQTELRAHGIDSAELFNARSTPEGLRLYLQDLGQEVQKMYSEAFAILKTEEYRQQLAGIAMGRCYQKLLREIERDGYHVIEYSLALPPHRKIITVIECWLRAQLGIAFKPGQPSS